ncbi:MAG: hypothetical protein MOIL_00419 [Candidatus Methanolliviera sp. GoM_oil]|nr:MAG: hypothetical protein MOIL_00419 [Candidatus Methanolliviera sp. GoM_oil]
MIILWHVIGDCVTLTELCDSLKGILPERYHLIAYPLIALPKTFYKMSILKDNLFI